MNNRRNRDKVIQLTHSPEDIKGFVTFLMEQCKDNKVDKEVISYCQDILTMIDTVMEAMEPLPHKMPIFAPSGADC